MTTDDEQQLIDELIGEAVLGMLRNKGPITLNALYQRLNQMLAKASDSDSRYALSKVIFELDKTMNKSRNGKRNGDFRDSKTKNIELSLSGVKLSPDNDQLH